MVDTALFVRLYDEGVGGELGGDGHGGGASRSRNPKT